jgi:hypothetical protein
MYEILGTSIISPSWAPVVTLVILATWEDYDSRSAQAKSLQDSIIMEKSWVWWPSDGRKSQTT